MTIAINHFAKPEMQDSMCWQQAIGEPRFFHHCHTGFNNPD
jgi:hypothetical protein